MIDLLRLLPNRRVVQTHRLLGGLTTPTQPGQQTVHYDNGIGTGVLQVPNHGNASGNNGPDRTKSVQIDAFNQDPYDTGLLRCGQFPVLQPKQELGTTIASNPQRHTPHRRGTAVVVGRVEQLLVHTPRPLVMFLGHPRVGTQPMLDPGIAIQDQIGRRRRIGQLPVSTKGTVPILHVVTAPMRNQRILTMTMLRWNLLFLNYAGARKETERERDAQAYTKSL